MKNESGIVWMLAGLVGLSGPVAMTGWGGEKTIAPSAPASAEKSGWTLAFSDDFKRAELGPDWEVVDGAWIVSNGCLRGSGTLMSARGFPPDDPPGYLRLEFDAVSDVKPFIFFKDKPKPKVSLDNLSSFIHSQPRDKVKHPISAGYFFQVGSQYNTQNQLKRNGQTLQLDTAPKTLIAQDQVQQVVLENDKGNIRCFVDGELVLQDKDPQPIIGKDYDRVGFYFYTAFRVSHVKVYVKRLPNGLDLD